MLTHHPKSAPCMLLSETAWRILRLSRHVCAAKLFRLLYHQLVVSIRKWVRDLIHMYHVPVVGKSSPRAFSQGELGRLESGMTLGCVGFKF